MKNILISGNKGFIGSHIQRKLQEHYHIIGLNREEGVDITQHHTLESLEFDTPARCVIHTAAVASESYEEAFAVNVTGTLNICRFAKERGIGHVILLSTIFAIEHEENGYFNSYGQTKKMADELALAYCKAHNIDLTILRLAQVYDDAGMARNGQAMLYYFVDTIREKDQVTIFGRRNPLRNYIHIDYLCDIISEVIASKTTGIWNVVEERDHTIGEIAYILFDLYGKKPHIFFDKEKPDIPTVYIPREKCYISDNIETIPLKEGLKRIIFYER